MSSYICHTSSLSTIIINGPNVVSTEAGEDLYIRVEGLSERDDFQVIPVCSSLRHTLQVSLVSDIFLFFSRSLERQGRSRGGGILALGVAASAIDGNEVYKLAAVVS